MKKATSLLVVLAMFMSASCGALLKDEEEAGSTSLVGTWKMTSMSDNGQYHEMSSENILLKMGASDYKVSENGCVAEEGTYATSGNTLALTATGVYDCGNGVDGAAGDTQNIQYNVDGDKLLLTSTWTDSGGSGESIMSWTRQ